MEHAYVHDHVVGEDAFGTEGVQQASHSVFQRYDSRSQALSLRHGAIQSRAARTVATEHKHSMHKHDGHMLHNVINTGQIAMEQEHDQKQTCSASTMESVRIA